MSIQNPMAGLTPIRHPSSMYHPASSPRQDMLSSHGMTTGISVPVSRNVAYTPQYFQPNLNATPYNSPISSRPTTSALIPDHASTGFMDPIPPPSPLFHHPANELINPTYPPYYETTPLPFMYPPTIQPIPPYPIYPPTTSYSTFVIPSPVVPVTPTLPLPSVRPPFKHYRSLQDRPSDVWTGNADERSQGFIQSPGIYNTSSASPLPFFSPTVHPSSYPPPIPGQSTKCRNNSLPHTTAITLDVNVFGSDAGQSSSSSSYPHSSVSPFGQYASQSPPVTGSSNQRLSLGLSESAAPSDGKDSRTVSTYRSSDEKPIMESSQYGAVANDVAMAGLKLQSAVDEDLYWGIPQDEYYALPMKDKRAIRNKMGARRFRARRKVLLSTIEDTIDQRDEEIQNLNTQLTSLRDEIDGYRRQLGLSPVPRLSISHTTIDKDKGIGLGISSNLPTSSGKVGKQIGGGN